MKTMTATHELQEQVHCPIKDLWCPRGIQNGCPVKDNCETMESLALANFPSPSWTGNLPPESRPKLEDILDEIESFDPKKVGSRLSKIKCAREKAAEDIHYYEGDAGQRTSILL